MTIEDYIITEKDVRTHLNTIAERAESLFAPCDIIPMPQKAKDDFLDEYSWGYRGVIATLDVNAPVDDWIEIMERFYAFKPSFHHIDKFSTNSRTRIRLDQFVSIIRYYQDNFEYLDNAPHIAYAIDENLNDGEVKWEHNEHYQKGHTPEPSEYSLSFLISEGSLRELKKAVEKAHWNKKDLFKKGGISLGDVGYSNKRKWLETKKVIEYIADVNPDYNCLFLKSVHKLGVYPSYSRGGHIPNFPDRKIFYKKTMRLALEKGANPNIIDEYGTPMDILRKSLVSFKKDKKKWWEREQFIEILQEAIDILRSYGGMSKKELRKKQDKEIAQLAPDYYDYLKKLE